MDHKQAITESVQDLNFQCPQLYFAVEQPYNAIAPSCKSTQDSSLPQSSSDANITTSNKRKRKKSKVKQDSNQPSSKDPEQWLEKISIAVDELVKLGKSNRFFELKAKCIEPTRPCKDTICFSSLVELAKLCGNSDGALEKGNINNGNDAQITDFIGKLFECASTSPIVISALGTKFLFPAMSRFFLSDISELSCLANEGKKYDLIVIDPPWENKSVKRSKQYQSLSLGQIKSIPVPELAVEGALVVIWVTNKKKIVEFVKEQLMVAWKLKQIGEWHWVKVTNKGEYVFDLNSTHKKPYEPIIIGRYSESYKQENSAVDATCEIRSTDSQSEEESVFPFHKVICSTPSVLHSRKPPLNHVLKQYLPSNPSCLELFARSLIPGWTSWGNEVLKFQNMAYFDKREEKCLQDLDNQQ